MKEVIIDGIVYVPKESVREDDSTPPFKVGQWILVSGDLRRVLRVTDKETFLEYGFNSDNPYEGSSGFPFDDSEIERLATPEEIETYLIAEAERRGFKKGVSYISVFGSRAKIISTPSFVYFPSSDMMGITGIDPLGNDTIYYKGKWAKIIKEPRPLPKTVEELNDLFKESLERFRNGDEDDLDKSFDKFMEEFR